MSMFFLQTKTHLTDIFRPHRGTPGRSPKAFSNNPDITKKCLTVSPHYWSEAAKCLSMLTSLLAAGQDSQLCQTQPPHPTLTQLGSPFSPRTFPTLFPRTNKSNPSLPLMATLRVSPGVSCPVLGMF